MSEFVNPNIPAVVDGATVTLDPLWIDGGPGNPQPAFDVNDPTMWLPLTVMSGLASGYCERRAVVSSGFKVAAGAAASTTVNWYEATDEQKAAIVSACANNMALGRTMTSMFYSAGADANGQLIGSATGGSDYMTRMDSAITGLITGNASASVFCRADGSRYSTASNNAASTFSALAADAKTRADSYYAGQASASISAPVRFGGSSLKTEGYPGLPMEWALERKWMLDELKYVGGGTPTNTYFYTDVNGAYRDANHNQSAYTATTAQSAFSGLMGDASQWETVARAPRLYCGLTSSAAAGSIDRIPVIGLQMSAAMLAVQSDTTSTWSMQTIGQTNETKDRIVSQGAVVYLETAAPIEGSTVTAEIYMAQGAPMAIVDQGTTTVQTVSNAITAAANVAYYKVMSGGTLTVPSGVAAKSILVYSGGTASLANGCHVSCCTVLSGGVLTGIKNVETLNIDAMYPSPSAQPSLSLPAGTQFTVVTGTMVITEDSNIQGRSYYVPNGGTLVFSAVSSEFIYTDVGEHDARIFVDSGGSLIVKGTPLYDEYDDLSGYAYAQIDCPVVVFAGGTVKFGLFGRVGAFSGTTRGQLVAFPSANVYASVWWDPTYHSGTWNSSIDVMNTFADTTNFNILRITPQNNITDRAYDRGDADIHMTRFTNNSDLQYKPAIQEITHAVYVGYGDKSDPFDVEGTTVSVNDPSSYVSNPDLVTIFGGGRWGQNVSLYLYNALGFCQSIDNQTVPLPEGLNIISLSGTSIAGVLCVQAETEAGCIYEQNGANAALYLKGETANAWNRASAYTETSWPSTLYTSPTQPTPSHNTILYTDAAGQTPANIRVYSVVYPLLTGGPITLPDSPTSRRFLSHYYDWFSNVYYRCAIADVRLHIADPGLPESHYTSFRVRQFFNDPGLVPVPNTTTT